MSGFSPVSFAVTETEPEPEPALARRRRERRSSTSRTRTGRSSSSPPGFTDPVTSAVVEPTVVACPVVADTAGAAVVREAIAPSVVALEFVATSRK